MKRYLVLILPIILLCLAGCNDNSNNRVLADTSSVFPNSELNMPISEEDNSDQEILNADEISKKLIRNGSISFRTSNLDKTRDFINETIIQLNGYISSENTSTEDKRNTITLTVRVPANNFDSLLDAISSRHPKVDYQNIYVEDVTQDFIDIEARLSTKKELEQRYMELLKNAKSVSEILEIEKQIGELRSEIESYEGRLRYLSKQVNYSTLRITFYDHNQNFGFSGRFENGLKSGWTNMLWLIVALANLWAIILFIVIIWLAATIIYRRRRKRRNQPNQRIY